VAGKLLPPVPEMSMPEGAVDEWRILFEYARLREGLNQLSEDVKHLMVAEQRRFLKELKSSKEKTDRPRMTKRRLGAASRNYEG
jgi:hypothetical protein